MSNNYFRYLNQKCPICEKEFTNDDDIVVCPLCGTPHHRECYKQNGECGNYDKHNEGFRWAPVETEPQVTDDAPIMPQIDPPVFNSQNAPTTAFFGAGPDPLSAFPKQIEEDVATEEVAEFVQLSAFKYIQNFFYLKSKKKAFSWAAFFLAPYWFFYRKLHKVGAILMALMLASSVICSLPAASDKFSDDLYDFMVQYQNAPETEEEAQAFLQQYRQDFMNLFKNNVVGALLIVAQLVVLAGVHIFAGFKANELYYKHTINKIRKIKEENADRNQQKLMFFKEGGISLSATILAVLSNDIIMMAASYLIQYI